MASTSGMKKEEEQPQEPQVRLYGVPGDLQKRTDGVRTIDAETQRKVEGLTEGAVQPRFISTDGNVLFSASGERLDSMLHRTGTYTNPNDLLPLYVGDNASPAEGNKSENESTPKPASGKTAASGAAPTSKAQGPSQEAQAVGKEWPAGAAAIQQLAGGRPVGERAPFVTYKSTGGRTLQIPKGDTTGWMVVKDENGNETAVRTTGAGQPYQAAQPAQPATQPGGVAPGQDAWEVAPGFAPAYQPPAGGAGNPYQAPKQSQPQWSMPQSPENAWEVAPGAAPAYQTPGDMAAGMASRAPGGVARQPQQQAPMPQSPSNAWEAAPGFAPAYQPPSAAPQQNSWSDPPLPGYDASTGMMAPAYVPSAIPLGPQAPQPQGLIPMPYGQPGNWREGAW